MKPMIPGLCSLKVPMILHCRLIAQLKSYVGKKLHMK